MDRPMDKIHESSSAVWLMLINNSGELDVDSGRRVRRDARDTAEFRNAWPRRRCRKSIGRREDLTWTADRRLRVLKARVPAWVRALLGQVALRALQYVACRCGSSPSSWSGTARTSYG